MPSSKEMRDELRRLRKENQRPVSKMRVTDVAAELERLRGKREETPSIASTPIEKNLKVMKPKVKDMKESKAAEFPTAPAEPEKKKAGKKSVVVGGSGAVGVSTEKSSAKKSKLEKLLSMLESDSE